MADVPCARPAPHGDFLRDAGQLVETCATGPSWGGGSDRPGNALGGTHIARLDDDLEVIDNEINDGNVVLTIRPSDFAVKYRGRIERLT